MTIFCATLKTPTKRLWYMHSAVEYALRDLNKSLGIAEFQLQEALPETFQGILPIIAELEVELQQAEGPKEKGQTRS
jgi:hypothetical protein